MIVPYISKRAKLKSKESNIFNYLISNKSFIDWVRDPTDNRQYFWKKWIEEHPDNLDEIIRAKKFVQSLKFKDQDLSSRELDDLFGNIIRNQRSKSFSVSAREKAESLISDHFLKIAASVSMLLLCSFVIYWFVDSIIHDQGEETLGNQIEWVEVVTARGERKEVVLPDSSVVNLNYESSLRYPSQFDGTERVIELSGEGFFEVTHDKTRPFKVKTESLETQVLGTSFNINSFLQEEEIKVSLVSGIVEVSRLDLTVEEPVYHQLIPGEEMVFEKSSKKLIKEVFDVENTIAWKDGILVFKDVGFQEFIDRLEKWYDVNFQIFGPYPKQWSFNGRYENEEIENILVGVKFVYDLDYSIQGKNVTLKFK